MNNMCIVGTCSICGGAVVVPIVWMSVVPPTKQCSNCGAIEASNYGPIIKMVPNPSWADNTITVTVTYDE